MPIKQGPRACLLASDRLYARLRLALGKLNDRKVASSAILKDYIRSSNYKILRLLWLQNLKSSTNLIAIGTCAESATIV